MTILARLESIYRSVPASVKDDAVLREIAGRIEQELKMNWLKLVLTYLPVVLSTVTAVEAAVCAPGATKKQVAMGIITAGTAAGEQFPEEHVQQVAGLVDVVVGMLNKAGVFASKAPVTATAK
jgi:hypothetical protein